MTNHIPKYIDIDFPYLIPNKVITIKAVRFLTGVPLKEAKDIVETCDRSVRIIIKMMEWDGFRHVPSDDVNVFTRLIQDLKDNNCVITVPDTVNVTDTNLTGVELASLYVIMADAARKGYFALARDLLDVLEKHSPKA